MARLNIQLPDSLLAAAKKAAHKDEISLSEYIRGVILYDLGSDLSQSVRATGELDLPIKLPPRCETCTYCDGSGFIGPDTCVHCDGSGWLVPEIEF